MCCSMGMGRLLGAVLTFSRFDIYTVTELKNEEAIENEEQIWSTTATTCSVLPNYDMGETRQKPMAGRLCIASIITDNSDLAFDAGTSATST